MLESTPGFAVVSRRALLTLPLVVGLALGLAISPLSAATARAQDASAGQKTHWQDRYRTLLNRQAELRSEIDSERALYAAANRRNYRRGTVRHVHLEKVKAAEEELAGVESALEDFAEEARRAGALPGWLYEVEEEQLAKQQKAGDESDEDATAGRNPRFLPSKDDEKS